MATMIFMMTMRIMNHDDEDDDVDEDEDVLNQMKNLPTIPPLT